MKVTFVKKGARRYAVEVKRERYPDLWCGSIGYDDFLPHDLLHFVAEAEFGLDGAVFGDLAAGGNARIFQPTDPRLVAKDVAEGAKEPHASPGRTPLRGARLAARAGLAREDAPAGAPTEARRARRALARTSGGRLAHARVAAAGRKAARERRRPTAHGGVSVRACLPARAAPA
jgi:hypothetical protein